MAFCRGRDRRSLSSVRCARLPQFCCRSRDFWMIGLVVLLSAAAGSKPVEASPARRLQVPRDAFLPSMETLTQPINPEESLSQGNVEVSVNSVESSKELSLAVEETHRSAVVNEETLVNTAVDRGLPAIAAVDGEVPTSTAVDNTVEAFHLEEETTAAPADGSIPLLSSETSSQEHLEGIASSDVTVEGTSDLTPAAKSKIFAEVARDASADPEASQSAVANSPDSLDTTGEAALTPELADGATVSVQKGESSAGAIQEELQDQDLSANNLQISTSYNGPFDEDAFTLAEAEDVEEWGEFLVDEKIAEEFLGKNWRQHYDDISAEFLLSEDANRAELAGVNTPQEGTGSGEGTDVNSLGEAGSNEDVGRPGERVTRRALLRFRDRLSGGSEGGK
ncbi:hypothetical protein KFL_000110040 [Klebsormidium nitens]|uniref:Uncharacterized protein n=1 Tax=Klebsormidium nitens TaxID=105231 RepID=A0A1Y1HP02_KLENI|nr:hypothetical protein KFL_000110040 [Klebsormidium nitens]|eukprot:GAQ78307.1 hypothetical protein KFL_000110040 [Klebsormidium nitens]